MISGFSINKTVEIRSSANQRNKTAKSTLQQQQQHQSNEKSNNNNNWEKWIKNKSSIDIVPHNRIARNLKIVYFLNTFTRYRCVWCYTLWLRDSSGIFKCAAKHLVRIQFSWFALRADLLEEYTVIIDTSQLIKIATDIHAHNRHTMDMTRGLQHNHTMW